MSEYENAAPSFDIDSVLASVLAVDGNPKEIRKKLENLVITIEGDHIAGSIDYQVAQSIVQLQQTVYRIAAHALYGEVATVKSLNETDLEKFKLTFTISPGCTNIFAKIFLSLSNLVGSICKDMTPSQKIGLAILLGLIFAGYVSLDKASEYFVKIEEQNTQVRLSQEETNRLRIVMENMSNGGQEAAYNFARAAKGASGLTFGGRSYSSEDLAKIQKRTPRTPTNWETSDSVYVVVALDMQKEDVVWATIKEIDSGETFKASYTFEVDEDTGTNELLSRMADSMIHGSAITLKVSKGKKPGDDKVTKASILELVEEHE